MPAFRMTIELARMADIEAIEDSNPDTDDDSVELIIKHGGNQIQEQTDIETASAVLEKLDRMETATQEALEAYEYSGT